MNRALRIVSGLRARRCREVADAACVGGTVNRSCRRGAFVASRGLKEIIERFEAMAALEGMCGALAARRITDEQRAMLLAVHEECQNEAKNGASDPYYYANERFHQTIYEACHNTYLAEQARQLHNRLKPYRRLQLRARHRIGHSLAERQKIVDAIMAAIPPKPSSGFAITSWSRGNG